MTRPNVAAAVGRQPPLQQCRSSSHAGRLQCLDGMDFGHGQSGGRATSGVIVMGSLDGSGCCRCYFRYSGLPLHIPDPLSTTRAAISSSSAILMGKKVVVE